MIVRIEKTPAHYPWMKAYTGHTYPVEKTQKTEKGVTAVAVKTPEGLTWLAAHNLRRVEETEDAA